MAALVLDVVGFVSNYTHNMIPAAVLANANLCHNVLKILEQRLKGTL